VCKYTYTHTVWCLPVFVPVRLCVHSYVCVPVCVLVSATVCLCVCVCVCVCVSMCWCVCASVPDLACFVRLHLVDLKCDDWCDFGLEHVTLAKLFKMCFWLSVLIHMRVCMCFHARVSAHLRTLLTATHNHNISDAHFFLVSNYQCPTPPLPLALSFYHYFWFSSVQSHLFLSPIGARTLKMPVPYSPPSVGVYTRTPSHRPPLFGRRGTDHLP